MDANRQDRLVAVLGHELRNPLAAALTGVSLVREMVDDGDPRQEILTQAVGDLQRVARLVASFLEFSRARNPRRQPLDLRDLAGVVARRRRPADASSCELVLGGGPAPAAGDPVLLERVLENLVENAAAVGATRVTLESGCRRDPQGEAEVFLDVVDNGPGVPPHLRDRIFEPSVSGRGSSGLGLAIAADIVAAHGGRISLHSGDGGAAFRITLPAADAGQPPRPSSPAPLPVGAVL